MKTQIITGILILWNTFCFAVSNNLIFNGDFETLDEYGNIIDWKKYSSKEKVVKSYKDSAGKGENCLLLTTSPEKKKNYTNDCITTKGILIQPGKTYTLSFFAKSPRKNQTLKALFYTYSNVKPHYYRSSLYILTKNWRKFSFTNRFPTQKEWKNRHLYVRFYIDSGEAYVDNVTVIMDSTYTPPYLKESVLVRKNNINLLENPGFELDWQGWYASSYRNRSLYYSGKDERFISFDDTEYVHGGKSLKLSPFSNVISKRQRYIPDARYTCSFYAKIENSRKISNKKLLTVYVITPKWNVHKLSLHKGEITDKWKRFSFSFTVPDHGSPLWNSFYVRLNNSDCYVWLDSFKLEKGGLSNYDFTPQIGFKVSEQDAILKLGAETELDVMLQSDRVFTQKLTLKISASDIYGKIVWQRVIKIDSLKKGITLLNTNFRNREKGVIAVKAVLSDESGNEISKSFWRYWVIDNKKVVLNPLFGYQNRVDVYPVWVCKKAEKIFSLMGAEFQRNFLWTLKYSSKEVVDLKILKYLYNKHMLIKSSGRKINMTNIGYIYKDSFLYYANKKYQKEPCRLTPELVDKEIEKWGKGFKKILQATSPVITHYEILNEINLHRIKFKGSPSYGDVIMTPKRYVKMLKKAKEVYCEVAPQAKIGICLNRIDISYVRDMINAGLLKYIDFFSFHSYQGSPECPPVYKQIKELKKILSQGNRNIPVFNSEQYFGVRNYLNCSSQYDRVYYSDHEGRFVGCVIQNYLHHIVEGVPFSLFSPVNTAFMIGMSNPIYYYYTVGAYRNLSQLFTGVKNGRVLDLNDALRSFLFRLENNKKIVSFNTKTYGKTGKVTRSKLWSEVLDINGNPIKTKEISLSFLPCYAVYPSDISEEKIVADLKILDFQGLSSPFKTKVTVDMNGDVKFTSINTTGKAQSEIIKFEKLPENWKPVNPILLKNIPPGKMLEKVVGHLSSGRDWRKTYIIKYSEEYPEGVDTKIRKLPSLDINKISGIVIDGNLDDWKKARWLKLDKRNLSRNYSKGKMQWKGNKDLSAELALSWDEKGLYIALKVTDNILDLTSRHGNLLYTKDSIQIYFDLKNDDTDAVFKAYDFNDVFYQIGFCSNSGRPAAFLEKNPAGRYIGANNQAKGIDSDVKIAYRKTDYGYIYEIAFPKAVLPFLKFNRGSEFALDILINDNDGKGRKTGLTLSSIGDEPHCNTFFWKAVRLY